MFLRPFLSVRNELDFALRALLPFGLPVRQPKAIDLRFAAEVTEFLQLFDWPRLLPTQMTRPRVLDVGSRNFATVLSLQKIFEGAGREASFEGIEIDAYRRLADFRTRADYGHYYAAQVPRARFHAMDFLHWTAPADVVFLLNPFVTIHPLLLWGLPGRHFRPERTFEHAASLLTPGQGLLVVSSPTEHEFAIASSLCEKNFRLREKQQWTPGAGAVQGYPRFGAVYQRA